MGVHIWGTDTAYLSQRSPVSVSGYLENRDIVSHFIILGLLFTHPRPTIAVSHNLQGAAYRCWPAGWLRGIFVIERQTSGATDSGGGISGILRSWQQLK